MAKWTIIPLKPVPPERFDENDICYHGYCWHNHDPCREDEATAFGVAKDGDIGWIRNTRKDAEEVAEGMKAPGDVVDFNRPDEGGNTSWRAWRIAKQLVQRQAGRIGQTTTLEVFEEGEPGSNDDVGGVRGG